MNNNNGLGNPVPKPDGQTGLNDIINNNAGVHNSNIAPEGIQNQINPMDQVVTPQPSNLMEQNVPQGNVDNSVMPQQPFNNVGVPQNPMAPNNGPEPLMEPNPMVQNVVPGPQAPMENSYQAQPNITPQPEAPMPAAPINNAMPTGQPLPSFTSGTIGMNPPIAPESQVSDKKGRKEGKKGINKTLFVVLLIVIMAAIGGGVYWYLNMSKDNGINVALKDVTYSLNEEPSTNIADYATITGANGSSCVLDTSKIDTSKIGEYEYTITCNGKSFKGKALVADDEAPVVSTISVYKTVNSEIKPEEFIATCYDSTKCSYKFTNEEEVKTLMATPGGPTKVKIDVTDENNNTVTVEANLNVIQSEIRAYYDCLSTSQNVEKYNASMVLTHSLGILKDTATDGSLAFGNFGTQTYKYTFTDQEQFGELLKSFKNDGKVTIGDVTGVPEIDQENMTMAITSDLELNGLITQYGADKFMSFKTISEFYKTTLGYTCQQKAN